MKTLRELFSLYHSGFQDFGPWLDHHREMHRRHPLDVPEFGAEWLRRWEAVGRLLNRPAKLEFQDCETKRWWVPTFDEQRPETVEDCLERAIFDRRAKPYHRRVVLAVDGTIIREWGPK